MTHRQLVAILRGISPDESVEIATALADVGITLIEIPINSPQPLDSIALAASALEGRALIGAGTVLIPGEVDAVAESGGRFIVSPNTDAAVIARTVERGMGSYPGVMTPTEAFAAIGAGATALKFFPSEIIGTTGIRAMKAVLPPDMSVLAVGGAHPGNFREFKEAGCSGFGLGSFLYRPGRARDEVARRAQEAVEAYDAIFAVDA